jgi:hypothetical protein
LTSGLATYPFRMQEVKRSLVVHGFGRLTAAMLLLLAFNP